MTWFPGQVAAVGGGNQLGVGEDCVVGRSEGRGGADERDVVGIEPATGAIARRAHDLASRHPRSAYAKTPDEHDRGRRGRVVWGFLGHGGRPGYVIQLEEQLDAGTGEEEEGSRP